MKIKPTESIQRYKQTMGYFSRNEEVRMEEKPLKDIHTINSIKPSVKIPYLGQHVDFYA